MYFLNKLNTYTITSCIVGSIYTFVGSIIDCIYVRFFFAGLTFGSGHDEEPYVLDAFYHDGGIPMFKKSDGFWYDLAGNKYKDRNGEEVVKRKH